MIALLTFVIGSGIFLLIGIVVGSNKFYDKYQDELKNNGILKEEIRKK